METSQKLGEYFATGKRGGADGESFVSLKDERPDWLHDAVREIHQGDLPNDWIYAECEAACDSIDCEILTDEDSVHEYADGRVDIYTRAIYQWAADMANSSTFSQAEEDVSDMGMESSTSLEKRIQAIQYCAVARIARAMMTAAEEASAEKTSALEEE